MEFMGQNGGDLNKFVCGVNDMRRGGASPKAIQAFFDMGCHFYGKDVVIAYLKNLEQYDLIKEYVHE